MPASTAKLFSTALALERLGPGYRFTTSIVSAREPDANGRLAGDLRLVGGGDPTLSGRVYPYKKDAAAGNPLGAIEELADAVVARGVKRIEGDIVGDDTAYALGALPRGQIAGGCRLGLRRPGQRTHRQRQPDLARGASGKARRRPRADSGLSRPWTTLRSRTAW